MTAPLQKPYRSKQDYGTPLELLIAVKRRLGIHDFDCDLAATKGNAITDRYLTVMDDSLSEIPWLRQRGLSRGWNWLNPPYGDIEPWVAKAGQQQRLMGARTAVLIPASVGSNWWRDHVHGQCGALFLNPRLTFVGCKDPYPKDCALLLYDGAHFGYDVWSWRTPGAVPEADAAIVSSGSGQRKTGATDCSSSALSATEDGSRDPLCADVRLK